VRLRVLIRQRGVEGSLGGVNARGDRGKRVAKGALAGARRRGGGGTAARGALGGGRERRAGRGGGCCASGG